MIHIWSINQQQKFGVLVMFSVYVLGCVTLSVIRNILVENAYFYKENLSLKWNLITYWWINNNFQTTVWDFVQIRHFKQIKYVLYTYKICHETWFFLAYWSAFSKAAAFSWNGTAIFAFDTKNSLKNTFLMGCQQRSNIRIYGLRHQTLESLGFFLIKNVVCFKYTYF